VKSYDTDSAAEQLAPILTERTLEQFHHYHVRRRSHGPYPTDRRRNCGCGSDARAFNGCDARSGGCRKSRGDEHRRGIC
jgi:hypothetical protein